VTRKTKEFEKFVKENFRKDSVVTEMLNYIKTLERILKRIETAARENDMEKVWRIIP
jgi:hypothetical protein